MKNFERRLVSEIFWFQTPEISKMSAIDVYVTSQPVSREYFNPSILLLTYCLKKNRKFSLQNRIQDGRQPDSFSQNISLNI